MINVTVNNPTDRAWRDWSDEACTETGLATAARGADSYKIKERLYKAPVAFLLEAFANKCGYCETKIDVPTRKGDVDHFRPKGRITNPDRTSVFVASAPGDDRPHPGYYWLVYDWSNFIPSCPACNRPGEDLDGLKSGKWDLFPLASDFRALEPGDEINESPLLINPREDNPSEHLIFDTATGIIGPLTAKGDATIKILGLNRHGLPEERMKAYEYALGLWARYQDALAGNDDNLLNKLERQSDECRAGRVEYAAFVRIAFAELDAKNEERQKRLRRFLGR